MILTRKEFNFLSPLLETTDAGRKLLWNSLIVTVEDFGHRLNDKSPGVVPGKPRGNNSGLPRGDKKRGKRESNCR